MALTYSLYLDQKVEEIEIANALANEINSSNSGNTTVASSFISVGDYEKEIISKNFGFTPEIGILFRLDKFAGGDSAFEKMIKACLALLKIRSKNAVLVFEGEATVFLYKDSALCLNSSRSFWEDRERVRLIDMPFEFKPLPNLD